MSVNYNIISLFSGGGFLDLGFLKAGFKVQEAFEIDSNFIDAYNEGIRSYVNNSSVIEENFHFQIDSPKDLSCIEIQNQIGALYEGISGLVGGPPCQDFSVGGKNKGIEGYRGKLIFSYFEIVKKTMPNFLFFENVEGLIKNNSHKISFLKLVSDIEQLGYYVWYTTVNALEYGVPQDRPRLVLVAFRQNIIDTLSENKFVFETDDIKLKNSSDVNYVFKWPQVLFNNPKDNEWPKIWEFKSKVRKNEVKHLYDELACLLVKKSFQGLTKNTPNQNEAFVPYSEKFTIINEGDTNRKSFKRLHRYRYSPTVAYGNNEVHLHPTKPRRLTVREAMRLQSIPDEYVLPESIPLTHKFKLISNGVPPIIAELIANEIKATLRKYQLITSSFS